MIWINWVFRLSLKTWHWVTQTTAVMKNTQMISKMKMMTILFRLKIEIRVTEMMMILPLMKVYSSLMMLSVNTRSTWEGQELKIAPNSMTTSSLSHSLISNRKSRKLMEIQRFIERWILNTHKRKLNHSNNVIKNQKQSLNRKLALMSTNNCMKCLSWKFKVIQIPEKDKRELKRSVAEITSW